MTISISALLTFSVAGIVISRFAICFFFAAGPSDPAALHLKYALKSVFDATFTEKNNYDKNTFETLYLHFKFY